MQCPLWVGQGIPIKVHHGSDSRLQLYQAIVSQLDTATTLYRDTSPPPVTVLPPP